MRKLGVGAIAALVLLGLTAAVEPPDSDIRWYASRPHYDQPIELQDEPGVVPLFEIRTGWLCDAGRVERHGDGRESRVVQCEKGRDRIDFSISCGPGQLADAQQLRFSELTEPTPFARDDALTVGCIVR